MPRASRRIEGTNQRRGSRERARSWWYHADQCRGDPIPQLLCGIRRFHRQCVSVHFKVDGPRTRVPAKGREVCDENTGFVILVCLRHWPGVMPTMALKVRLKDG